jgi:hypothetical protein
MRALRITMRCANPAIASLLQSAHFAGRVAGRGPSKANADQVPVEHVWDEKNEAKYIE